MLRVITVNLNGIRSAVSKGILEWLVKQRADCVCMQEVRAQQADMSDAILMPNGLHAHFACADRKGYAGVAMYCHREPERFVSGYGSKEFDAEGRFLQADFGPLSIVSLYMPSGSSGEERQAAKFRFMAEFMPHLQRLTDSGREFIVCGDWNIAHKEVDLKNWKSNQKNSGFLPEERAWLSEVFDRHGWVDVYRRLHPDATSEGYTWWSNRGQAYAKNVGWRIDYQIATPGIAAKAMRAEIYKAEKFSDHAPLIIDYDWAINS
ncbi:MAG TPA: exodeoxyribonuclease III [Burkholderiales bacterium]